MEYLLPRMGVEFVMFIIPVLVIFLVVVQFGVVNRLGDEGGMPEKGFAVALLVLLISPILIMMRSVIFSYNPMLLSKYGLDMLFLLIVWGGLFYTLNHVPRRMKQRKMMFLQRASAACSSVFAFMFASALLQG